MNTINKSRHPVLNHRGQGLQSQGRAEFLRNVWAAAWKNGIVKAGPGNPGSHADPSVPHHHGALTIFVPASKAAVMAETMDFMGSIVDEVRDVESPAYYHTLGLGGRANDTVMLCSRGYWAHDF